MSAPNSPQDPILPRSQQSLLQSLATFLGHNGRALFVILFWVSLLSIGGAVAWVVVRGAIWAASSVLKALGI